jgi:hypothetical protein
MEVSMSWIKDPVSQKEKWGFLFSTASDKE